MTTMYAIRFTEDDGERKRGEFMRRLPPYTKSTADLSKAHLYKRADRASTYGAWLRGREVVAIHEEIIGEINDTTTNRKLG